MPTADLSISVTDGATSVAPGTRDTYTITVTNNGPDTLSSLTLSDAIPAALLNVSFTPSVGTYDVVTHTWSGLNLASGQSVGFMVACTVDPTATGTLTNTVLVLPPSGTTDPTLGNNSASDSDTLTPQSDANAGKGSRRTSHAAVWRVLLELREGCFVICCHRFVFACRARACSGHDDDYQPVRPPDGSAREHRGMGCVFLRR